MKGTIANRVEDAGCHRVLQPKRHLGVANRPIRPSLRFKPAVAGNPLIEI